MHGIIFSHALSTPAAPVQVSQKILGGDWKHYDYYYGVNVTAFDGRFDARNNKKKPKKKEEWVDLVHSFPEPQFPIDVNTLPTLHRFKSFF